MNMDSKATAFHVLLIDDDIEELAIVQQVFKVLNLAPVTVDHAYKCSDAVNLLNQHRYDLVLLDDRLSGHISAEFSAPFILHALSSATVAIISNDINRPYLRDPDKLGLDFIVDKAKIIPFLRDIYITQTTARARRDSRIDVEPMKTAARP